MQEPQLSRRRFLEGIGAAGTLGLPGCFTGENQTQPATEGTGYFVPGGERYWGATGPATWFSPATAYAKQTTVKDIEQFTYRPHRLNVWGIDLGVKNLDLLFVSPHGGIEVYEGAFTADEAREISKESFTFDGEYEYRGFQILTEDWNGLITTLAFQDGRVVKINDTIEILDHHAAIEAVIDTVTGNHPPLLPTEPYYRGIRSELQTDLFWEYRRIEAVPRLPDLWAEGQSLHINAQEELLERHVYGFTSPPDFEQATLDREIESAFDDRMRSPTVTQQDKLLILEASAPLTEIDSKKSI